MRRNRRFKQLPTQPTWWEQYLATLWNRWSLFRAKKLADQYCLLERCRVYVLPIQGSYVVTPNTEVKLANRQVGKGGQKNILDLLNESVYTVTYDSKNKTISKKKELKLREIHKPNNNS